MADPSLVNRRSASAAATASIGPIHFLPPAARTSAIVFRNAVLAVGDAIPAACAAAAVPVAALVRSLLKARSGLKTCRGGARSSLNRAGDGRSGHQAQCANDGAGERHCGPSLGSVIDSRHAVDGVRDRGSRGVPKEVWGAKVDEAFAFAGPQVEREQISGGEARLNRGARVVIVGMLAPMPRDRQGALDHQLGVNFDALLTARRLR
jgi:hypothetical protein